MSPYTLFSSICKPSPCPSFSLSLSLSLSLSPGAPLSQNYSTIQFLLVFWSERSTLNQEATQGVPCDAHRGPHRRHRLREDHRRIDLSGRRPRGHRPRRDLAPSHEDRALGVPEGRPGLRKGHPHDRRERRGETPYRGASTHPLPPPPSLSLSLSLGALTSRSLSSKYSGGHRPEEARGPRVRQQGPSLEA